MCIIFEFYCEYRTLDEVSRRKKEEVKIRRINKWYRILGHVLGRQDRALIINTNKEEEE